jgi:uncharacterized membrane protein
VNKELHQLELKISTFLRAGTVLAGSCILTGWLWSASGMDPFFNFREYDPISFHLLFQHALDNQQWGTVLTYAGLLALISLPMLRVLLTLVLFMRQGDRKMAGIATIVLLGLILSMSLGVEH